MFDDLLDHTYDKTHMLHAACVRMAEHARMLTVKVAKLDFRFCRLVMTNAAGPSVM